ncbi:Mov34/MPN/PAD-1 family protein, partial [Zea mays]
MELVARVHLRLRAGILSPTKGALEARAVAAGGGLVDDPVPPDPLACGLTRCSLNPQIYDGWTKCPGNSTVPVHTHCRPALCCCRIPTVSLCFVVLAYWGSLSCCRSCAIILSMVDLSFSLYTVDSTRGLPEAEFPLLRCDVPGHKQRCRLSLL